MAHARRELRAGPRGAAHANARHACVDVRAVRILDLAEQRGRGVEVVVDAERRALGEVETLVAVIQGLLRQRA